MKPAEFKRKFLHKNPFQHFPRTHLLAAGVLGVGLCGLMALFPSRDVSANRQPIPLAITLPEAAAPVEEAPQAPVDQPSLAWTTLTVKSGDNLSLLFQRAGLTTRDVYEFTNSNQQARALKRIYPGHQLAFQVDEAGQLQQLKHIKNKLNTETYQRTADGFVAESDSRTPDIQMAYREARIETSLVAAAQQDGVEMDLSLTMALANIFGWDVDFSLDIRRGDQFKVLYEEKFLDGERLGHGDIIAAEFINQGTSYKAVRYLDADGEIQYYTPEGKSMRKDFLRTPLSFLRISSNFNPRRLHPVLKTVRPHRGTDYAAPTGTPVWTTGDGRVTASGYSRANGNYVFIRHSGGYVTKYLHLSKRFVKKGERVKQKQRIGSVGSTGLASGPHLHYEFLMNGVHRNPRTIINKLPKAKSISDAERADFIGQTQPALAQLDQYHQSRTLALAKSKSSNTVN